MWPIIISALICSADAAAADHRTVRVCVCSSDDGSHEKQRQQQQVKLAGLHLQSSVWFNGLNLLAINVPTIY